MKNLGTSSTDRKATMDTFDFIITDIAGVRYIKANLGSQFKRDVECKLRPVFKLMLSPQALDWLMIMKL